MLFFDGRAVGRVRHDHGFTKILGCLARIAENFRLQLFKPVLEESELIVVHVILVAHLQDFGFGQESFRRHLACFFNVRQNCYTCCPHFRVTRNGFHGAQRVPANTDDRLFVVTPKRRCGAELLWKPIYRCS
jgi:hypothetical protein